MEKGHYHPDFGASWDVSGALPRVTAMEGGFRTNVVPPEAWAQVAGVEKAALEKAVAAAAATGAAFALEGSGT